MASPLRFLRFSLLVLLLFASCLFPPALFAGAGPGENILDVPFYPQEEFQCGPAALASVMNYWGDSLLPGEIAEDVFSKNARGTLNLDLVLYARARSFEATHGEMTPEGIRGSIDRGAPVIALVDSGFWLVKKGHYVVVVGYSNSDSGGVLVVHDGLKKNRRIALKDFLRQWGRSGHWGLILIKKGNDIE